MLIIKHVPLQKWFDYQSTLITIIFPPFPPIYPTLAVPTQITQSAEITKNFSRFLIIDEFGTKVLYLQL
jgi:hypothetical protein